MTLQAKTKPSCNAVEEALTAAVRKPLAAAGDLPMPRTLLSAGVVLDPVTEREREARLEALKQKLSAMLEKGNAQAVLDLALGAVLDLERENERLSWRLLRAIRYRFGRQSERLSREELGQLALALGFSEAEAAKEQPELPSPSPPADGDAATTSVDSAEPTAPKGKKNRKRKVGGSTVLGPDVPTIVTEVPVAEADRCCALCGADKVSIGPVEHEVIAFVPAKIELRIERREELACACCKKDVVTAPRSAPATGRRFDSSLLAKLVKDKCANGLPLDRQRRELARLGADIPDKTLASLWAHATDLLEPVAEGQRSMVFGAPILGVDDTHLRTLDRSAKGGSFRGRFWCFVGTDGTPSGPESVAYAYAKSWDPIEIQDWFSAIDGVVQCDGYAGYSAEVEDDAGGVSVAVPDDRRIGCMMHVRSKFHAALLAKDKRAAVPLKLIADLYAIEAECKALSLDAVGRGAVRRDKSIPLLDTLDAWIDDVHVRLLPKAPLRTATQYAINQRAFVRACFADGRFEIDNGRTERRIRPFAVGRRNFLFTGSPRGGARLATAFTLVDNCLLLGLDPQCYLEDVLSKLEGGWRLSRLSELLPARWAAAQAAEKGTDRVAVR